MNLWVIFLTRSSCWQDCLKMLPFSPPVKGQIDRDAGSVGMQIPEFFQVWYFKEPQEKYLRNPKKGPFFGKSNLDFA